MKLEAAAEELAQCVCARNARELRDGVRWCTSCGSLSFAAAPDVWLRPVGLVVLEAVLGGAGAGLEVEAPPVLRAAIALARLELGGRRDA